MNKNEVLKSIADGGLIPVARTDSGRHVPGVAAALREGGVPVLEVTMTVPGAVRLIEDLTREHGDEMLIGAGTVLDPETARICMLAGARFIVSPALNEETVEICRRYSVATIAGALTPTEVFRAWQVGADVVKIFPCAPVGGADYIRMLKGPFPQVDLTATGGTTPDMVTDLIHAGAMAVGIVVDSQAIADHEPQRITDMARTCVRAVQTARS